MAKLTAIVALLIIAVVITGLAYSLSATMATSTPNTQDLTVLAARRQDLLATQLQVEQQLSALNASVQAAIQQQQSLAA